MLKLHFFWCFHLWEVQCYALMRNISYLYTFAGLCHVITQELSGNFHKVVFIVNNVANFASNASFLFSRAKLRSAKSGPAWTLPSSIKETSSSPSTPAPSHSQFCTFQNWLQILSDFIPRKYLTLNWCCIFSSTNIIQTPTPTLYRIKIKKYQGLINGKITEKNLF